jgi:hypothetical protein
MAQSFAFCFTTPQMTLGLKPVPQILPALLIERKSVPVVIPAAPSRRQFQPSLNPEPE